MPIYDGSRIPIKSGANTAARLAAQAAAGEIIVSEQALRAAGINGSGLEARSLELKGIREPILVRVMHGS